MITDQVAGTPCRVKRRPRARLRLDSTCLFVVWFGSIFHVCFFVIFLFVSSVSRLICTRTDFNLVAARRVGLCIIIHRVATMSSSEVGAWLCEEWLSEK